MKGGCLLCVRGSGPLGGWSGELSITGECQGMERQEVRRALFLLNPEQKWVLTSILFVGQGEEGIWRRGVGRSVLKDEWPPSVLGNKRNTTEVLVIGCLEGLIQGHNVASWLKATQLTASYKGAVPPAIP